MLRVTEPTVPGATEPAVVRVTEPTVVRVTEPTVPRVTEPTVPRVTEPTVPRVTEPTVPRGVARRDGGLPPEIFDGQPPNSRDIPADGESHLPKTTGRTPQPAQ
ncbi:hypothetical protein GCM10029976_017770 [Kribbella albertanoniae]